MRENIFIVSVVCMLLLVTACNNSLSNNTSEEQIKSNDGTITCTNSYKNDDGYDVSDTMVVTYKDSIVTYVEKTNIEKYDAEQAEVVVSVGQAFSQLISKIDGLSATYSKESDKSVKYVLSVDYSKLDTDSLKENLGDFYDEDNFYNDKNLTIDEFKSQNLVDYVCN